MQLAVYADYFSFAWWHLPFRQCRIQLKFTILHWTPNSLDLNLIDTLWDYLDRVIRSVDTSPCTLEAAVNRTVVNMAQYPCPHFRVHQWVCPNCPNWRWLLFWILKCSHINVTRQFNNKTESLVIIKITQNLTPGSKFRSLIIQRSSPKEETKLLATDRHFRSMSLAGAHWNVNRWQTSKGNTKLYSLYKIYFNFRRNFGDFLAFVWGFYDT